MKFRKSTVARRPGSPEAPAALSIYLSIYLSVYLSIYIYVYIYIYICLDWADVGGWHSLGRGYALAGPPYIMLYCII